MPVVGGPVPRGREPKKTTSRVVWTVWAAEADAEARRLETELKRVSGESYWRYALTNGKERFEMIVPAREELTTP